MSLLFFPLFLVLCLYLLSITRKKPLFFLPLSFISLSLILIFIATGLLITETAETDLAVLDSGKVKVGIYYIFCNSIVNLAFWPSILLKVKKLISFEAFLLNSIGWGLIGFIMAIIFTKFKPKTR